jgi:lipopolysaccharide transport system permease protein
MTAHLRLLQLLRLLRDYLFPWQHRSLIWQLARREVLGRYRGSYLGITWSFAAPLAMLLVYTFVFVSVFKARWPGMEAEGGIGFAIQLMAGLLMFNLFAEVVNKAPQLIREQSNLVKKVIFPLEILPWVCLASALFHLLLNLAILIITVWIVKSAIAPSLLLLPLILLAFAPFLLGLAWLLSALGVYIKDTAQAVPLCVNLLMFLSPVFYPVKALPESIQAWIALNPLSLVIESVRKVVLAGQAPDWSALALHAAIGLCLAAIGIAFFHRTRKGFADVV